MTESNVQIDKASLIKNTLIAAALALILLFAVVLPAEYGIDPLGIGGVLGLKEISKDEEITYIENPSVQSTTGQQTVYHTEYAASAEFVYVELEIEPYGEIEYKFEMQKGDRLIYQWQTDGGLTYSDLHGHTMIDGESIEISYLETQESAGESGELMTPFAGEHGWYWASLEDRAVKLSFKVGGQFTQQNFIDMGGGSQLISKD